VYLIFAKKSNFAIEIIKIGSAIIIGKLPGGEY